ncbi:MAG: LysR family transcriptional regulator [Hydrogenophaga sp.]|uniref:LysR family transcriptional regulator n=1 Tax=Hydrogenophaga sp. TaxID=1904254 RepID=UPI001D6F7F9A|nr:LysR family transcriptional regulator [Hydrogenophaga sp.]MBX3611148.1 LysR family transcriptional regulator [Hydrogenophaga sp.]
MTAISQSFRCFDAVARRGSVRQAAESLHLTAAAVNQQILKLEALVGTPLFDRLPRGMQLTSAGEIMIAAVRRSQRDFDSALAQVEDLRALRRGHVNVGVSHSTAEYLLPEVVESVQRHHPGITFSVRSGNGETLLRWLANGEIDVAYCLRRAPPPGVEEVRSHPQQLGVVTAPGHPLTAGSRRLRVRDCLDQPMVMLSPDMELRTMLNRIEPRLARLGRPLVETTSVPMVRRLVAGSHAVGFLIPENVTQEVADGALVWVPLDDAGARQHSCIYQRSGYTTAVAMGLFLGALESAVVDIRERFERDQVPRAS